MNPSKLICRSTFRWMSGNLALALVIAGCSKVDEGAGPSDGAIDSTGQDASELVNEASDPPRPPVSGSGGSPSTHPAPLPTAGSGGASGGSSSSETAGLGGTSMESPGGVGGSSLGAGGSDSSDDGAPSGAGAEFVVIEQYCQMSCLWCEMANDVFEGLIPGEVAGGLRVEQLQWVSDIPEKLPTEQVWVDDVGGAWGYPNLVYNGDGSHKDEYKNGYPTGMTGTYLREAVRAQEFDVQISAVSAEGRVGKFEYQILGMNEPADYELVVVARYDSFVVTGWGENAGREVRNHGLARSYDAYALSGTEGELTVRLTERPYSGVVDFGPDHTTTRVVAYVRRRASTEVVALSQPVSFPGNPQ